MPIPRGFRSGRDAGFAHEVMFDTVPDVAGTGQFRAQRRIPTASLSAGVQPGSHHTWEDYVSSVSNRTLSGLSEVLKTAVVWDCWFSLR